MSLSVKDIKKYKGWSVKRLKPRAEFYFHLFIRLRDTDENGVGKCISNGQWLKIPSENAHAGHFYASGNYPELKFNEDNVHLQSKKDNYFGHSNALEYRKNLIKKIGIEKVERLDLISDQSKRNRYKWERLFLIEVIVKYRVKCKELAKTKNFKVNGL